MQAEILAEQNASEVARFVEALEHGDPDRLEDSLKRFLDDLDAHELAAELAARPFAAHEPRLIGALSARLRRRSLQLRRLGPRAAALCGRVADSLAPNHHFAPSVDPSRAAAVRSASLAGLRSAVDGWLRAERNLLGAVELVAPATVAPCVVREFAAEAEAIMSRKRLMDEGV